MRTLHENVTRERYTSVRLDSITVHFFVSSYSIVIMSFLKDNNSHIMQNSTAKQKKLPIRNDTIASVSYGSVPEPTLPSRDLQDASFLLAHPNFQRSFNGSVDGSFDGQHPFIVPSPPIRSTIAPKYSKIYESLYKTMGFSKDDSNARLLGSAFFLESNVEAVQQLVIVGTYIKSGKKFKIKRQKQESVVIVMRNIFVDHGQFLPCDIENQVQQLNRRVVNTIVPGIVANCISIYHAEAKYGKNQLGLMDRPERTFNNYKPLVVTEDRFSVFLKTEDVSS